jgi:hypothetical protein
VTPQNIQQSKTSVIELGTRTTSTRQAVPLNPNGSGPSGCTGSCYVGTVGGMLRSKSNGTLYLVSNAHVWASPVGYSATLDACHRAIPPRARSGDDLVYQSGTCNLAASAHIGQLVAHTQLTPGSVQRVDAALATVFGASSASTAIQMGLGAQAGGAQATPALGMIVVKSSRTSGFTVGQVSGVDLTLNVLYGTDDASDSSYLVRFVNQLLIDGISPTSSFTRAGDSGSFVFEYGTMRAVGINFAGGSLGEGVVTPMHEVFSAFFPNDDGEMAEPASLRRRRRLSDKHGGAPHYPRHPANAFTPRSDGLHLSTMPSLKNVAQACRAKAALTREGGLIEHLMHNNTIVAHYVGIKRDEKGSSCIFVMINTRDAGRRDLLSLIPREVNDVQVIMRYADPIVAAHDDER